MATKRRRVSVVRVSSIPGRATICEINFGARALSTETSEPELASADVISILRTAVRNLVKQIEDQRVWASIRVTNTGGSLFEVTFTAAQAIHPKLLMNMGGIDVLIPCVAGLRKAHRFPLLRTNKWEAFSPSSADAIAGYVAEFVLQEGTILPRGHDCFRWCNERCSIADILMVFGDGQGGYFPDEIGVAKMPNQDFAPAISIITEDSLESS